MFKVLNTIIENDIKDSGLDFYSVIIGAKPSHGARSPKLWNKVYEFEGKNIRMVPLDVKENNLKHLLDYLKEDKNCLGGAIAVPYKEKIFNLMKDNLKEEIRNIGAINCFYRPISRPLIDEFTGTNTDGEAALDPIRDYLTKNENLSIFLLGFGGAGKAIMAFLFRDFGKKHRIHIFNRSPVNLKNTEGVALKSYSLNELASYLPNCDLMINATSVGQTKNSYETPVSTKLLKMAKKTMVVYDIIYDPLKTTLLNNSEDLGLKTINGLQMNLIQAVLAYSYTNQTILSSEEICTAMS